VLAPQFLGFIPKGYVKMQILVLNTTTKTIKASMATAAETTNPDFVVAYADNSGTSFTEAVNDGALNGVSDVTLVSAPGASVRRIVKDITICNRDTKNNTITLKYDNNGTERVFAKVTLAPNETWTLNGAFDERGAQKTSLTSNNNNQTFTGLTQIDNLQVPGNAIILGNLTIEGTTTTLNVNNLLVEDSELVLLSNTTGAPVLNASITIDRGSSQNTFLRWSETDGRWGWSDDGTLFYTFNTARDAYAAANSAANTARVSQDGALVVNDAFLNFVNTSSITVAVGTDGSTANISFTNQTGLPVTNIVSGNTTAIRTNHYYLAPNAGNTSYDLTLPASPVVGDTIWVTPVNGQPLNTIVRNGEIIQGLAEDMIIDSQFLTTVQLRYANTGIGWVLT
jgi:hypothetical protein